MEDKTPCTIACLIEELIEGHVPATLCIGPEWDTSRLSLPNFKGAGKCREYMEYLVRPLSLT